ncbi:scavenger receptor cysteine-rich domain superfamily protein-like, partial [Ruditapes philippinarum]|uniref:scavenger receptor cysteine-rich domain superfamily protein-like n=1 Tax=Ruditapes philippinarum TaxID=129788 RepID=UPI00295B4464
MHVRVVNFFRIEKNMESTTIRKALTIILLVCLLFVLVVFCVVYIWSVKSSNNEQTVRSEQYSDKRNAEDTDTTTEHLHSHNEDTEASTTTNTVRTTLAATTTATTTQQASTTESGPSYRVKLSGGQEASSGKVLIEHDGQTGFVCSDHFSHADAKVVCKELGFKNGLAYNLMASFPYSRYTEDEPILSNLNCIGNEVRLKDCNGFRLDNVTSCTWFAAALCYNNK